VNLKPLACPAIATIAAAVALALTACSGSPAASNAASTGNSTTDGGTSSASPAAEPGLTTFICAGSTSATLLQWTDSNDDLSGTYEYSSIGGQAPSTAKLTSSTRRRKTMRRPRAADAVAT
jgi:hypothetical protein